MDRNLDTVKREILEYLEASEFAVFRGNPGGLEGFPLILWDSERFPDYREFLEVARKAGVKIIQFAAAEFDATEIDDLLEQLDECTLSRDERRDLESRLRDLRVFDKVTCSVELAFDLDSRLYVFELQTDWYDEFLSAEDEINAHLSEAADADEGGSLGGYFSKN